jgi:hypothetical protein
MKALGLDQGTILTEDLEDEERVEGRTVRYVPLWRWLVEPFGRTPSRVQNAARRERRTGAD